MHKNFALHFIFNHVQLCMDSFVIALGEKKENLNGYNLLGEYCTDGFWSKNERHCQKEFHGGGAYGIDHSDREQIQNRFVPMPTKKALIKYHLTHQPERSSVTQPSFDFYTTQWVWRRCDTIRPAVVWRETPCGYPYDSLGAALSR